MQHVLDLDPVARVVATVSRLGDDKLQVRACTGSGHIWNKGYYAARFRVHHHELIADHREHVSLEALQGLARIWWQFAQIRLIGTAAPIAIVKIPGLVFGIA
jgi:hypothetical protein